MSSVNEYLTTYYSNNNDNQLSRFSINKSNYDIKSMQLLLKETDKSPDSESLRKVIIGYRLPALLTYRLLEAIKHSKNFNIIIDESNHNYNYIKVNYFNNGLRSLKLLFSQLSLFLYVFKKRGKENIKFKKYTGLINFF